MTKSKILLRLTVLLLLMAGGSKLWAMNRTIPFANQNRISNNGAGVFTSADNAGNVYALALADLSNIPGITTAGTITIQFDSYIPSGSRWNIGIGNKDVRGTNANGSNQSSYNTDGLILRFGTTDGNNYRVNGGTNNNNAFGKSVHATITFNRIEGTYSYTLTDNDNSTVYFSETNIATSVANPTIIEVYSWQSSSSVTLSNVTIQYEDLYFEKYEDVVYIEDIEYSKLTNGTGNTATATYSTSGYFRLGGDNLYPIKTTGDNPTNLTEGNPITVTVTAGTAKAICRLRIKTRNMLDSSDMKDNTTNTFDVGSTIGLFNSQVISMTGMTLYLSYNNHTPVVRNINGAYGITIIDKNGYTFGNWANDPEAGLEHEWGTVYKIMTTEAKNLSVSGYFSSAWAAGVQLYDDSHNAISGKTISNPGNGTLATATFTLEAGHTYYLHQSSGYDHFCLKSLSYRDAYFEQTYAVTAIGTTYTQTVQNMESPVYSIIGKEGDIASSGVSINSSTGTISGITAGGALKIQATGGGKTCVYYLTVAYPATPYPGKLWDFNQYYESGYQPPLSIDENGYSGGGFPRIDANSNGTVIMTDGGPNTITDEHGDTWVAELKNVNYGSGRDARWRHANAVHGDNAFIVSETAGLVFNTGGKGFFVRNDRVKYNCWGHVGIRQNGASFTIPQLTAGDIVEINWKRESGGAGGEYTATNVTDLRYKPVSEQFEITGSQNGTTGGVLDVYKNPGYTSFIATGGDVTFTLRDGGATDILSIRIYSGGYRSTMRTIQDTYHRAPETSMLLDYQDDAEHNYNYQEYEYDYCNVLNSTNTGPAFYVLKGYRRGVDNVECVTGTDAVRGFEEDGTTPHFILHEDNDATYPAYPVSAEESTKLYNLRKNLVGFRMYNHQWQSQRNSYNNGRIGASGGWGKVTIRMNNYTNDMKYVIGYTNDVTMTFGSRPHQLYPYTWDFTHISAQAKRGASTNAFNTIKDEDLYETNWNNTSNGVFSLDIDNTDQYSSQYVPGAVLVTTDRALSKVTYYDSGGVLRTLGLDHALDELDGLGVNGKISFDSDQQLPPIPSRKESPRRAGSGTVSLLSFSMDNYKVVKTSVVIDGETIVTDWQNTTDTYLAAGNGWVKFGADRITETSIAACGFAYKCDYDVSVINKGIYLRPARKLKNGDVITVKLYATSTPNGSNYGLCIYPENISTASATLFISSGLKNTEETLSYTVTSGDGLADQSMIMLYRNTDKSVYLSEVQITGDASSEPVRREIFCETQTTLTIPEVNAGGKQDWIYVSASDAPTAVVNATLVSTGTDGPDANTDHDVYKYKVTAVGDAYLTFAMNTRIYKIGVTHILKEIHPVGGTGWATEIRNHSIDHELTGYFTKNDVNAYTVGFDSYDLTTATVGLSPILEDGYVPELTGMVLRLDNVGGLTDANTGKYVPLFYPSYTRDLTTTAVDFPDNNLMYNNPVTTEINNQNYNEVFYNPVGNSINYTKFVLTNVHWKYTVTIDNGSVTDKQWEVQDNAAAAGFRRLHIWSTTDVTPNLSASEVASRNTMPANTAFLCVPSEQLPVALWGTFPPSSSRLYTLGIRELDNETTDLTAPRDDSQGNGGLSQCWYTLDGTKLSAPPTKAGIYICGGRKVVIK